MVMGLIAVLACQREAVPALDSSATTPPPRTAGEAPGTTRTTTPSSLARAHHSIPPAEVTDPFAWSLALARVEEIRGSAGIITTPPELLHHEDRRRFLAVQMADSREEDFDLPHDQGELVAMILEGKMVELPQMSEDILLYEVGTDAREDPLAHFDRETGKDVPLLPSLEAYREEDERLASEHGAAARERRELLTRYYGDPGMRERLFREHEAVTTLASNFGGERYDLSVPEDRHRFQVRLLSVVRPEAREVALALARAYRERFSRHLPVTSLVRTERYQQRLARGNPNATHVEIPPHSTGMAFDVSYKFMAPDEQNFVMEQVAQMEREGRVEALRERRNHIHIYALSGGLPSESLVAGFLADVEAAHPGSAPGARVEKAKKTTRSSIRRASQKKKAARAAKARPRSRRAR
jgi:hypothetical protein